MEYHNPATEYTAPPPEFTFPSEDTLAGEFYEYTPGRERRAATDRHSLLKKLMTLPIAASLATLTVIFAAQDVDPLGKDVFNDGKSSYSAPVSSDTNTPAPVPPSSADGIVEAPESNETVVIHIKYIPSGPTRSYYSGVSTAGGAEALKEAKKWLIEQGGDPATMKFIEKIVTYIGPEGSDTLIMVQDPKDHTKDTVLPDTHTNEYRVDYYFEGYEVTGPVATVEPAETVGETEDEDSPFPTLDNLAPDFAGNFAWSGQGSEEYVRVQLNTDGDAFTYLHQGSVWALYDPDATVSASIAGAEYDRNTNTLTLTNFNCHMLDVNLMGNGFTIRLVGSSRIDCIQAWGAMYGGSLTITGDGELYITNNAEGGCGIILNAEASDSCLMIDKGVTVDISADIPVGVYDSGLSSAIYWRGRLNMNGGSIVTGDRDYDGVTYHNTTIENTQQAVFEPK